MTPASAFILCVIYATRKVAKFSNTARIYRQHADLTHSSLSAIQWLRKSHYFNEMIVDEQKSMPLPTFIRTGDSYFRKKEHLLNIMVSAKGLQIVCHSIHGRK